MVCALQVGAYYDLLAELEQAIDRRIDAWMETGTLLQEDLGRFGLSS
jgi:hypothetical protein